MKHPITGKLSGQTGNVCFEIAATSALAWDHGAEAYFPDLEHYPEDFKNLFFRCKTTPPSKIISGIALEAFPMIYKNKLRIHGYFQSEKYFAHQRERILELFAPSESMLKYIKTKYEWLLKQSNTVGVQLRYYRKEVTEGYPQYGIRYLEKAMSYFSEDAFFIVSSDNIEFAKKNIPSWVKNVYFLENESPYTDLFLLSMCEHNIISNSTFGWWAAWLNQNREKIVICPSYWTEASTHYTLPVCPQEWIHIEADPESL
jgi:hypothetical protein